MYHLAIGDRLYSSWSLRGWLMFEKFGIPVEIDAARMYSTEFTEMLAQYGGGSTVPAMRIGSSETVSVWDTLAMAETLAERHPELNMWPTDVAARAFARSITAEMHSGFFELRKACTMNLRHVYPTYEADASVLAEVERIDRIWQESQQNFGALGPWLFGEYSLADVFYAPIASRLLTYSLPCSDIAKKYVETTISDPDFKAWRQDGLAESYIQPGYDLDLETGEWPVFDKN